MTPEEKVKAKLDKWVVPDVLPARHWHSREVAEEYLISTADLDAALNGRYRWWVQVWLEIDTLELLGAGNHTMSPIPETFEEVQNWVRMIDNLT